MEVILDMQAFKWRNNEFIGIEFVMTQLDNKDDHGTRIVFKPPCKWDDLPKQYKAINSWVTRNYHGIFWEDDNVLYDKFRDILEIVLKDVNYIYVKDVEKKEWLYNIIRYTQKKIINIEKLKCPPFKNVSSSDCNYHALRISGLTFHSVHGNVKQLKCWFEEKRKNEKPSIERSLKMYYQLDGRIEDMKAEDIAYFSNEFFLEFAPTKIDHIWEKLPIIKNGL
ncbi:hypothetical protein PV328_004142 [Microctonus aethiopoides]|uniref:Uncharacterized protein n=1 Tax=Microctonus aethiopoides TaxID=144406 RepID=A0AA39KL96_9HYME|nr:hypothetical protein PV328_004142 [Microctonus aethiopoides]